MLDENLRVHISAALQKTMHSLAPTSIHGVKRHFNDRPDEQVDIEVSLTNDGQSGPVQCLVEFCRVRPLQRHLVKMQSTAFRPVRKNTITAVFSRWNASSSSQENLASPLKNCKPSNELQSTNEELQSSNEEMQSSDEELHSVNEELYSVNSEYETKNRDLLLLNQDREENLLSALDIGTVFLDEHGRIRKFNPAIQLFFKLIHQDIGRPLEHIAYMLDDRDALLEDVQRARIEGIMMEREIPVGKRLWSWMRIMPFHNAAQELAGVVITFTNISQLKQAERDAAEARDRAEAADQAKLPRFLATMSHELRTPLNGVIGTIDLFGETPLTADQQDLLRTADSCSRHLSTLINDVLDYASLDQGINNIAVTSNCLDLIETIDTACTMVADQAFNKGLTLDCNIDPQVPQCIRGDRTRLLQIFSNLLNNSVKYTEAGFVRIQVEKIENTFWEFRVTDSGMGISPDNLEKIFIPFKQLDQDSSRRSTGVGLGLALCKHLAERMNGSLTVQSKVNSGSTFSLRLPIHLSFDDEKVCEACTAPFIKPQFSIAHVVAVGYIPESFGIKSACEACGSSYTHCKSLDDLRSLLTTFADLSQSEHTVVMIDDNLIDSDWATICQSIPIEAEAIYGLVPHGAQGVCIAKGMEQFITRPLRRHMLTRIIEHRVSDEQYATTSGPEDHAETSPKSILLVEDNIVNQQLISRAVAGR